MASTIYCIDSSALIAAWYERYRPRRFPRLWEHFSVLVIDGRLVSSSLVLAECSKRSPELHEWLLTHEMMFMQPDADVQGQAAYVVNTYPKLVGVGRERSSADPFLIATAHVYGHTIVTEEVGPTSLRSIPGVCNAMGVKFCNLVDMFDAEDWTIG